MRKSPAYYIAPSAISITPNANESANDLAVHVARGARIKVFSRGIPELGFEGGQGQSWAFSGRNRRLADSSAPYTIYARLSKTDKSVGYLVFAPKVRSGNAWKDKYPYVTMDGLAEGTAGRDTAGYWYVRLGDVTEPVAGQRSVSLDTGILGTEEFNALWSLNQDELPIRVVIGCTIDDEDAGPTPYVPWGKALQLHATLVEGWDADASERFDHWTIARNTGAGTDESWPDAVRGEAFAASGDITLPHHRDADDFSGAVSSVFTVTAWALREEEEEDNENSQSGEAPAEYVELAHASVTIMAETAERYELVLSSSVVSYSPDEDAYSPAEGIAVSVRVIDQRNDVRTLSGSGVAEAGISAYYAVVGMDSWTALPFSDGDVATAVLPVTAFAAQQDVCIRLLNVGGIELTRATVAFVRDGDSIRITGSSVAYAASDDGLNHPGDSSDPVADPDDVAVPDDIVAQTSQVLSSFDGIVSVPSGSATFAYLSKVMYEASRQYNDGESAYGLPVLYRKANFPNVIEYYGTETATSQAFRAMTGWLVALVLTEIRPDKRGALMRAGYNLGPSKDTYIYRYEFRSDPNVARLVASAIYAAMRGLLKPSLGTMRTELGAPDFTYTVAAVDAATYDDYRSAYYVDISGFMPTAPGPYLTGYTDRSAVGGAPYDGDDLADHNLQTDLDVYNIVVDRYNLDNAAYRQQTVQAIANIEHTAVHLFGDNVRTENYAFHPTFGTDTIGKRIATDGATASAVAKLGHLGSRNRNWLLEGSYYGRRRPGQGATDGSVKAGAQGVLMNYEIENGDGRGTGYATEAEYIAGTTASIRANSYPSGHSAYAFAGAMFLMELLPGKADLILRAANQYATDRQITRYHWLSDTITGRLAGAAIAPVERASADYASLLSAASIELGAGTVQSAWKATIAETGIRPGMYLWTRRTTSYSDGRVPTVEYSVARWGIDGDGIAEIDSYYLGTDDPALDITQETDAFPMPGTPGWDSASPKARWFGTFSAMASANGGVGAMQGWYIWEKTIVRYDLADSADGTERTAPDLVSYRCSRIGMDGQIGEEEYYMLAESDDFNTVFGSATPTYAKCGIRWYNQSNPAAANYRLSDTTPNINTSMWSAVMPAYDPTKPRKKYLWNFEQRAAGDGTEYATRPICIGNHARGITGVIELYALSASQTPVSASRPIPSDINSKNTFGVIPTSGFSDKQVWGDERYDRAPTEELPYQWNWTRTLYSAADDNGLTYEDHYHVSAVRGSRGEDGSGVEYIYYLGTTNHASGITPAPSTPASSGTGTVDGQSRYYAKDLDDWVPAGWTDNPQSIDYDHQVEWVSERRTKNTGTNGRHEWGAFSAPKVWSRWGKNGQDGDGVEYVYVRTTTNVAPTVGSGSSDSSGRTYLDDEYLPKATGGSLGSSGVQCTDDPSGVDASHPFEWVAKRTKGAPDAQTGKREWQRYSGAMALWANYNKATDTPVSAFQWNQSESVAPSPLPNGASLGSWSPTAPNRPGNGYYLWMTQSVRHTAQDGTVTYDAWSSAVRISGSNGTSGEDLKEREWIYKRQDTNPGRPASSGSGTVNGQSAAYSGTIDDWVPSGWTDNPQGVTNDNKTEWASWRDYDKTAKKWNAFSAPIIWSHYGERGIDGDGIQYVFKRFTTEQTSLSAPTRPSAPNEGGEWIPSGWTDDPQGVTETYKYEYVSTIKRVNGVWGLFETPALWAKWSADGKDGTNGKDGKDGTNGINGRDGTNGRDGESPWVADLDNEMDSVSCDGAGKPVKEQRITTKASLFYGETEVSFYIAVARNGSTILSSRSSSGSASSGGVSVAYNSSTKTVTIIYSTSAVISGKDEFTITLVPTSDSSVSRTRKLNVMAISGDVYNILPAVSQIRAGRTSDGGYTPSTYTLLCGYTKRVINGEMTVVERASYNIDGKYNLYFRKRYRTLGSYSSVWYRYSYWWDGSGAGDAGLTNIVLATYDAIEFILCTAYGEQFNDDDIGNYTVIDREVVPVVSDGTNGASGGEAAQGPQGIYEVKQYARSAHATSTDGSTPPADRTSDSDWETTPPSPSTNRPFIWQRTRLYNPATGNYVTSWAYVRLTGEPGDSAAAGKNGLWYAYAGVWGTAAQVAAGTADVNSVTNTKTQGWYVKYGNDFWMNVQGSGANTSTPSSSNTTWEKMKSEFKYYIANAYFGNYAHFGSFIINGDWMISQCGELKYYTSSAQTLTVTSYNCNTKVGSGAPYSYFKNSDPTGKDTPITGAESSWRFIPSFAVDGKTGKMYLNDVKAKGSFTVTSGSNKVTIDSNGFEAKWGGEGIRVGTSGIQRYDSVRNAWLPMFNKRNITYNNSNYDISLENDIDYFVNGSSNGRTLTLPSAASFPKGAVMTFRGETNDSYFKIKCASGDTIRNQSDNSIIEVVGTDRIDLVLYKRNDSATTGIWFCNAYDRDY